MRIVPTNKIVVITSNIDAQDYPQWNATSAYTTESKVTIVNDDKNYFATKDIAPGTVPDPTDTDGKLTGWFPQTNKRNMPFDYDNLEGIENDDSIDFSYRALNIDTISLFGLKAKELYIKMSDFDTGFVFYEKTISLENNEIHPNNYFFVPPDLKERLTLKLEGSALENKINELVDTLTTQEIVDRYTVNPPLFFNARIEVSIRNPGTKTKLGKFVSGASLDLGASLWNGSQVKKKRYGLRTLTPWGTYTLKKGQITNLITVPVVIDNKKMSYVSNILNKYAYQYCLFIGDESQKVPTITGFGIAEDELFNLSPDKSTYTLKIGSIL